MDQAARHLAVLESLRDMGHEIALAMKNRVVQAAAEGETDDEAAKTFALVAKTVQQIILLHREIKEQREKRRDSVAAQRKAQAKDIIRHAIDRADPPDIPVQQQRTEKVRAVQRVQLDTMFKNLDDDLAARVSVAEMVERACRAFGLDPDPTLRWLEQAEPSAQPVKAKPIIPAHLAGASALGLNGRAPPPPFAGPRERAPP